MDLMESVTKTETEIFKKIDTALMSLSSFN